MSKVLITGAAGFIGSHLVEGLLRETDWEIVILDRLDMSGNLERLLDIEDWQEHKKRVQFVWWDLKAPLGTFIKKKIGKVDYIWHVAASSHVDRSIEDPLSFVMDNVVGTCNILNYAREVMPKLFIYFSTDEVFGPAPGETTYKEWDRYRATNPYSASKAGGEELVVAFENTYKIPSIITHTVNVFGERQHAEKFIPLCIRKILKGEKIQIHSQKGNSGSRFYVHARNVLKALLFLTENHKSGDKYNISGEREMTNMDMAEFVSKVLGKPLKYELTDFHSKRPGNDIRYSLDGTKLEKMGFKYPKTFEESLTKTINWYIKNNNWLYE